MLDRGNLRIRRENDHPALFAIVDASTDRVIAHAEEDGRQEAQPGWFINTFSRLMEVRTLRWLATAIVLAVAPFWLLGALLGLWPLPDRSTLPRLTIRSADGSPIGVLRVCSGLMYDSRRLYDADGRLVAQFRSAFKTRLSRGFTVFDLSGCPEDLPDISKRPVLGHVNRLSVGHECVLPDGSRSARMRGAGTEYLLETNTEGTGQEAFLRLSVALALFWVPQE